MADGIKVSVICLAYNHEKYIRKCLDGFVMQKTNFKFEALVHDDASTDKTAEIIREYEEKYPDIIKPVYQTENQHSKKISIFTTFLAPNARGEYLAWCEGDDCWTDPGKLQKQVDFLDTHPDYSCCYHVVKFNNLATGKTGLLPDIKESRDYSTDEIIKGGAIFHLSSQMFRTEMYLARPKGIFTTGGSFGDIQNFIYGSICGKLHVLSDVMSQYNHGTAGSWTETHKKDKETALKTNLVTIEMYRRVNEYYDYKYNDAFQYAINRSEFNYYLKLGDKKSMKDPKYKEFYRKYKKAKITSFIQRRFPHLISLRRIIKNGKQ